MEFLAKILESVAIPSSRGSSQSRDQTCNSYTSCIAGTEPRGEAQSGVISPFKEISQWCHCGYFYGRQLFMADGLSCAFSVFSSILGLYPLAPNNSPSPESLQSPVSPDIARWQLGDGENYPIHIHTHLSSTTAIACHRFSKESLYKFPPQGLSTYHFGLLRNQPQGRLSDMAHFYRSPTSLIPPQT